MRTGEGRSKEEGREYEDTKMRGRRGRVRTGEEEG